jgi:hypothetical protein
MKKFVFVAALSTCAVTLISLAPAQARPDEGKRILPTTVHVQKAAVERTPEQMDAFDATYANPGYVREIGVRPTIDEAQYEQMKRAADMAPLMASKPGALLPTSPLVVVSTKFGGATQCDNSSTGFGCWAPPDVAGSIGKSQFVSVSNNTFEVRTRTGVLQSSKSLNAFFGYSTKPMFDPRVQYDEEYQRWIVTADAFEEASGTVQIFGIAVSKTSSATGAWWMYFMNTNGFTGNGNLYDFPMLGLSQDAVLFTANIFTSSGFAGSDLFSVAKARLYNGYGFSIPVFTGLVGTMQTAHQNSITDQNGYAWFAAARPNDNTIYMVRESFPASPPDTVLNGYYAVSVPAYTVPPSAAQPSGCGGAKLDSLDNRFQNAGTQNGDVYYQVHTEALGSFPAPRYYIITGLNAATPVLSATSLVFATSSSYDWNPSIASDPNGNFGINWSVTDPTAGMNPSMHFADNKSGNPTSGAGVNVFTGASCYTSGSPARWGDYSQVSVDPGSGALSSTTSKIFWIDNEVVPSASFWSTEIAKILF